MTTVTCTAAVHQQLIAYAQAGVPNEVCGLLFGRGRHISHAVPLPNITPEPRTTYLLEGQAVTRALRRHYRRGLEWVAVFHSHPQDERGLSPADRAVALGYQGVWQLLILPGAAECHLYEVTPGKVCDLPLVIVT
jgi:proteasome lid subunit RPN8/RPN11